MSSIQSVLRMPRNSNVRCRSMTAGTRHGSGLQLNARQSSGSGKIDLREQKMNMFGRRISTATCLGFVVLQFLLYACKAEAGEIRIAPQTQHLLLNVDRTATFFCQAVGINAFWSINDMTVFADGNSTLRAKGWKFNETLILDTTLERNNIHNLTLQIPSHIEFNNTKISCLGSVHDPAISDPVYLIIKEIVLSAAPGEIFAPSLFYTVMNKSISFSCDALGKNAYWGINGSTVNDEGEPIWIEKGFMFYKNVTLDPMGNEHFHHNTLQMVSHVEKNNTIITCAALDTSHEPLRSDAITVIIMGAPSSPVPIPIFDRPGVVTLEWDIPFSWSTYPVQSYDIVASNRSDLSRDNVNETRVQFVADGEQQECEMIEFKVRAISDLGDGEYGSVIAGFPIEPQLMDNSIDSIQISSQGSGQARVSMKIKLPRVCSYQSTRYTISITSHDKSKSTHSSVTRGPFNGTMTSDNVTFTENMEEGKTYQINVEFTSDVLPEPLMVFKDIYIEPPTQPAPPTTEPLVSQQSIPIQYIIIGGAAGGIVLLILIIVIIIIITAVHVRRRGTMRSWSPTHKGKHPMVTNPIYDGGPVYETIPPGPRPPLRLHSNSESSNITATSSVPPTPTSPLPPVPPSMESPYAYAPNQVDPTYAQPHRNGHVNFSFEEASYMIMSAVENATAGKRLSEGEELNMDHDGDSGSARYVPEPRQPYASASMV